MNKTAQNLFQNGVNDESIRQFEEYLKKNNVPQDRITEVVNTLKTSIPSNKNAPTVPNTTQPMQNTVQQVGPTSSVEVESPATIEKVIKPVSAMRVVADIKKYMDYEVTLRDNTNGKDYTYTIRHNQTKEKAIVRAIKEHGSSNVEIVGVEISSPIDHSIGANLRVQADVEADFEPYENDETWQYEGDDNEMDDASEHDLDIEFVRDLGEQMGLNWDEEEFTPEDMLVGMGIEWEHGLDNPETNVTDDDLEDTFNISLCHLNENFRYYQEDVGLPNMEETLKELETQARRYAAGIPIHPSEDLYMNVASLEDWYQGQPPVVIRKVKVAGGYDWDQYQRVSVEILEGPEKGRKVSSIGSSQILTWDEVVERGLNEYYFGSAAQPKRQVG